MRSMTLSTLTLAAAILLGACGDDTNLTAPSTEVGPEYAMGGGGKGKGGKPSNRIVYTHQAADGYVDIYSMNPDGSNIIRLTTASGYSSWSPRWTPDHRKIVFVSNRNVGEEIHIMNADGSNVVQLTDIGCCDRNPAPSPDGTRIAFQRVGAGIFLMNLDGSNPTQVTFNSDDVEPSWRPDGSQIVFANLTVPSIWRVNVDGTNRGVALGCGLACRAPVFSPDGTRLAFWLDRNQGEIEVYNFVTHTWFDLGLLGSGSQYAPAWSPDGSKIVFTAGYFGFDVELYSANASDGSNLTTLTSVPGADAAPSWHR
jgi:TolB protein